MKTIRLLNSTHAKNYQGDDNMPYPKPLSKKTLDRLYAEAGLNEAQVDFVRRFCSACAALYGTIFAGEAWKVYKELSSKTETVLLRRKDMYAALGILRREAVPFYVYEVDEVYSEEKPSDSERIVANRELVLGGYYRFTYLYHVIEASAGKPFFVPENLLEYETVPETKYERELLKILEQMKSAMPEYKDGLCHTHRCKYTGKLLKDFSYIDSAAAYELKRLRGEFDNCKGNAEKAAEFESELNSVNAAQYLVNKLKRQSSIGYVTVAASIGYFFDDLNVMGVAFSDESQINKIVKAINDMHNNQNLWCNHGWTPRALAMLTPRRGVPTISFGAGIQKAFADGAINKKELTEKLKEIGFDVEE